MAWPFWPISAEFDVMWMKLPLLWPLVNRAEFPTVIEPALPLVARKLAVLLVVGLPNPL